MLTEGSTIVIEDEMSECEQQEIEILVRLWDHQGPLVCTYIDDGTTTGSERIFSMKSAFSASGADETFVRAFDSLARRRRLHRRVQSREQLVMFTHEEPAMRRTFKLSFWLA